MASRASWTTITHFSRLLFNPRSSSKWSTLRYSCVSKCMYTERLRLLPRVWKTNLCKYSQLASDTTVAPSYLISPDSHNGFAASTLGLIRVTIQRHIDGSRDFE